MALRVGVGWTPDQGEKLSTVHEVSERQDLRNLLANPLWCWRGLHFGRGYVWPPFRKVILCSDLLVLFCAFEKLCLRFVAFAQTTILTLAGSLIVTEFESGAAAAHDVSRQHFTHLVTRARLTLPHDVSYVWKYQIKFIELKQQNNCLHVKCIRVTTCYCLCCCCLLAARPSSSTVLPRRNFQTLGIKRLQKSL